MVTLQVTLAILLAIHASDAQTGQLQLQSQSSVLFRRFKAKRISSQTTLSPVSIVADLHSICAHLCQQRGAACFAAQYEAGSFTCRLQLECGVVLLENAVNANTSVYVLQSLISNNPTPVRPYLYFPLVKGCNSSYSANYGLQSVSSPPSMIGGPSDMTNANLAMKTTPWFPTLDYPATTYGTLGDNNNRLNIFRSSFTVSFMVTGSTPGPQPVFTTFSSFPNYCLAFRVNPLNNAWVRRDVSCGCSSDTMSDALFDTDWSTINGWMHLTYAYNHQNTVMNVYRNGLFVQTYVGTYTNSDTVSTVLIGAVNYCSILATNSLNGSVACIQLFNYSVSTNQAATVYNTCINGTVFV